MAAPEALRAGLRVEEAIQAHQYTGPLYQARRGGDIGDGRISAMTASAMTASATTASATTSAKRGDRAGDDLCRRRLPRALSEPPRAAAGEEGGRHCGKAGVCTRDDFAIAGQAMAFRAKT
jgi:hypothetical protein